MERSDEPIYVREYAGINDDTETPEGRTFVQVESVLFIVLAILYVIGHFWL